MEEVGYSMAHSFRGKADAVERTYYYVTQDGRKPVVLGESTDSYALSAVLGSTSSALMNVLDGVDCVSFYPKLTLAGLCRGGDVQYTHEVVRFEEQGLEFIRNSGGGLVPCGYICANLWRSVRGSRAIGSFRWGAGGGDEQGCMERASPIWRLGGTCDNSFCSNPL